MGFFCPDWEKSHLNLIGKVFIMSLLFLFYQDSSNKGKNDTKDKQKDKKKEDRKKEGKNKTKKDKTEL